MNQSKNSNKDSIKEQFEQFKSTLNELRDKYTAEFETQQKRINSYYVSHRKDLLTQLDQAKKSLEVVGQDVKTRLEEIIKASPVLLDIKNRFEAKPAKKSKAKPKAKTAAAGAKKSKRGGSSKA